MNKNHDTELAQLESLAADLEADMQCASKAGYPDTAEECRHALTEIKELTNLFTFERGVKMKRKQYLTKLPVGEAIVSILEEVDFYKKHKIHRTREQIADLIASYSDNEERTIEISITVWWILKKAGMVK